MPPLCRHVGDTFLETFLSFKGFKGYVIPTCHRFEKLNRHIQAKEVSDIMSRLQVSQCELHKLAMPRAKQMSRTENQGIRAELQSCSHSIKSTNARLIELRSAVG
jgi:hypothetical protein